jgi:calcineurin-like phosphoesterase
VKILFIGDIVGSPGRRAVKEILPKLRQLLGLDVIIANGENSAGGNGITPDIAAELFGHGVDAITTGDHFWDQKEVMELLQNEKRFLRPLNYPPGTPGQGSTILKIRDLPPVAVMNVQGRTFMQPPLDNPTDAGFTGPHESVLGREIQPVLARFRSAMPQRFEVARNDVKLQGAVVEIDNTSGKSVKILRVSENLI